MAPWVPAGTANNGPCLIGCCSGMPCSACAAVALADKDVDLARPGALRFSVTNVIAPPGRDPDGLTRPPRSFA
jgi:hypothetical protein